MIANLRHLLARKAFFQRGVALLEILLLVVSQFAYLGAHPTQVYADSVADSYTDTTKIDDGNSTGELVTGGALQANYNYGDGADGAITVSSDTNINTGTLISGRSCADGGDAVNYSVSSVTDSDTVVLTSTPASGCLAAGDEVLLINQMGTSSNYGNVGNYEFLTIDSVSTDTINFTAAKTKYYGNGTDSDDTNIGTGSTNQRVMLQRVPNYTTVTVNSGQDFYPSDWNGTKGGVLAFRATGTVTVTGRIHANSKGYLLGSSSVDGGESFCDDDGGGDGGGSTGSNGLCGGGGGGGGHTLGYSGGSGTASLGGSGGGGGDGGSHSASRGGGGGGGGYGSGGTGGKGYDASRNGDAGGTNTSGDGGNGADTGDNRQGFGGGGGGGGTYGDAALSDIFFGSGGAGGGSMGGYNIAFESGGNGGDGGGIIAIVADTVTVTGSITATGGNGSSKARAGAGSGGAGGSIKISGDDITLGSSLVTATGGSGGGSTYGGNGGSGGTGRIAVTYATSTSGTTNPTANSTNAGEYFSTATIQSTNLLTGQTVTAIDSFVYNLSAKPASTTATIQFSQNATNWYNSSGTEDASDTLTTGVDNSIDLSGLSWTGANFYYKIVFGTNSGADTPVMDDVTVNYTSDAVIPTIDSVTSVAGDNSATYYDTTDDSSTEIIFVSSDDNSGVAACKWDTTDTDYDSMANSCASTTSCTTNLSGDGVKTVYLRCKDAADNKMTSSQSVTYTLDSTKPTTTITSHTDSATYNASNIPSAIAGTAADALSGIVSVVLSIYDGAMYWSGSAWDQVSRYWLAATGTTSWTYTFTPDKDDTFTVDTKATDVAGNVQSSYDSSTFTLDSVTPVISAGPDSTPADNGVVITWTTDALASTRVEYGPSTSYGHFTTVSDTSPRVTSHSETISNLRACTTYHYRVRGTDAAANTITGDDNTFTTTGCTGSSSVNSQTASTITTASGGTVSHTSGSETVSLSIPPAFGGADATFQIKRLAKTAVIAATSKPTSNLRVIGNNVYQFDALTDAETRANSFNSAITVTMTYTDADVEGLEEEKLLIYRWDGSSWYPLSGCVVDTAANSITCSTTAFSTFILFGSPTGSIASSNSNSCGGPPPGLKPPLIYKAEPSGNNAITLYFVDGDDPIDNYVLSFGKQSGNYIYGASKMGRLGDGYLEYTVNGLEPNTEYFFRVKAEHKCEPGEWSNEVSVTTSGGTTATDTKDLVIVGSASDKPAMDTPSLEVIEPDQDVYQNIPWYQPVINWFMKAKETFLGKLNRPEM